MGDWWKNDPIVETTKPQAGANWWEDDPVVETPTPAVATMEPQLPVGPPMAYMKQPGLDDELVRPNIEPTLLGQIARDDALVEPSGFSNTLEYQDYKRQPSMRAARAAEYPTGRTPLPHNAGRMEKIDRALHVVADPVLRTAMKFAKGRLLGIPEVAWAAAKRILPPDTDLQNMTLDQAIDDALDYNPGGFVKMVGELAELSGGLKTAAKIVPQAPRIASAAGKTGRAAVTWGLAEAGEQVSNLAAGAVDPDTEYGYEGAGPVAQAMATGGLFSGAHSGVRAFIEKTPAGKAIEEAAHRVILDVTKQFPRVMDAVRRDPQGYFTKQVLRYVKMRGGPRSPQMSSQEKAAIKHIARELERRFVKAYRNAPKIIHRAYVPPKPAETPNRGNLLSGQVGSTPTTPVEPRTQAGPTQVSAPPVKPASGSPVASEGKMAVRPVESPPPVVAKTQDISPDVTPPTEIPPASTETPASQSAVAKEPWEMTREEYESQYPESPAPVEFNDSKVTESVYHGSNQNNISEFFTDAKQLGGSTKAQTAKLGAFFSESPDIASMASFGFSKFGIFSENELSMYKARINLRNPLDINNMSDAELAALEQKFPGITKIAKEADDPFEVVQFIARSRRPVPYPKNPNFATYAKSKGLSEEQIKSAWKNSENPVYAEWLARENANIDAISNPVDGQEKLKDLGYDGIIVKTMMDSGEEIGPQKQYIVFNKSDVHIERRTPVAGHKIAVQVAKSQGKSIPSHVQAQYPDLFPDAGKKVDTPAPAPAPAPAPDIAAGIDLIRKQPEFKDVTDAEARALLEDPDPEATVRDILKRRGVDVDRVDIPRYDIRLAITEDAAAEENRPTIKGMKPSHQEAINLAVDEAMRIVTDIRDTVWPEMKKRLAEIKSNLGKATISSQTEQSSAGVAKQSPVESAPPVQETAETPPQEAIGEETPPLRTVDESKQATAKVESEAKALLPIEVNANDIDFQRAVRANSGIHHIPENSAYIDQRSYLQTMMQVYNDLKKYAKTPEAEALLKSELERFKKLLIQRTYAYLDAKSRVVSPFIAGRARFPVKQMEKRTDTEHKRLDELIATADNATLSIKKKLRALAIDAAGGEAAVMKRKLEAAKKLQEKMKAANKIYRNAKLTTEQKVDALAKLGISRGEALERLKPDYAGRVGYARYELTNNLANIKRMTERVKTLEAAEGKSGADVLAEYDGAKVVNNHDLQRVQIEMDEKPSEAVREDLRRQGWRWSPKNKAWQRQNTPAAVRSATEIAERHFGVEAKPQAPAKTEAALPAQKKNLVAEYTETKPSPETGEDVVHRHEWVTAETSFTPDPTQEGEAAGSAGFAGVTGEPGAVDELTAERQAIQTETEAPSNLPDFLDGLYDEPELPPVPSEKPLGREAGSAPILVDIATEIEAVAGKLSGPAKLPAAAWRLFRKNIRRARNYIASLGEQGKQLARDMDDIEFQASKRSNTDLADIREVFKGLGKASREAVGRAVNGKGDLFAKPFVMERAKELRKILDRAMNEAAGLGMTRKVDGASIPVGGSGKAFPQVPNSKGIKFLEEAKKMGEKSPRVFKWAQEQVEGQQFETVQQAIKALQDFRDSRLRGLNRYLESTRVELPEDMVEWDGAKILPNLLESNWMTVEGVRKWGDNFSAVDLAAEEIAQTYGTKAANSVKEFIRVQFGVSTPASTETQKLVNAARAYQFHTKVGMSPLTIWRNMTDRFAKGLTIGGLRANLKATAQYPPIINQLISKGRRIEDEMIRRGAVFGHGSLAEGYEAGNVVTELMGAPFSTSERGNQVTIALVKYHQLMQDIATYQKRGGKANLLTRMVNRIGVKLQDPVKTRLLEQGGERLVEALDKGEIVHADLISEILHRTVRDRAFPMALTTKPIWYDTQPIWKILAQFKTWPMQQLAMIWNDVVKYTIKTGDVRRLIGFLIGVMIAGELYNIARDFLLDKDESLTSQLRRENGDIGKAILNDLFDGGVVGMLADFTYGLYDWVTGPAWSTGRNIRDTGMAIIRRPELTAAALRRLVEKEVTPVRQIQKVIDRIDRTYVNKKNISQDYFKVRDWAWNYKEGYLYPELKDKIVQGVQDVWYGHARYAPGDNTLAYQAAERQLIVGDPADAAKYLQTVIDSGGEMSTILRTMRTSHSPYGHVKQAEQLKFLRQLPAKERAIAQKTQQQWEANLQAAVKMLKPPRRTK